MNLGLGCMRLSKLTIDESEKLISFALDNGITLFDHADIYGSRKCEKLFGEVLKRNPNFRKKMSPSSATAGRAAPPPASCCPLPPPVSISTL